MYGLRASPFFNQPLEPDPAHPTRPITLFVGREKETTFVLSRVRGSNSSTTLVVGGYGVGKTTFIHHVRFLLARSGGIRVSPSPIRLMSATTGEALCAELLRRLLATVDLMKGARKVKAAKAFSSARGAVERIDDWSGSLSVLGAGVGVGRTTTAPPHPIHDLVSLTYDLAIAILKVDEGFKLVVHLDNLENVYDPSTSHKSWLLLRDVRDLLQVDGLHLLMAGGHDFYRTVVHREQKVADVIGPPTVLGPLDRVQVWTALERRVGHLSRRAERPRVPVTRGAFDRLYDIYAGNMRGMFTIAEMSIEGSASHAAGPVGWDGMALLARPIAMDQLRSVASRTEVEYLKTIFKHFGANEFRQADLAKRLSVKQPTVSKMMEGLGTLRLIEPVRDEPPSRWMRLSGLVLMAFGQDGA